jgi:hypothetical protein
MQPMPAPKFATPRDLSRPTLGERQGKFARVWLGQPFMPWQQLVADVAGELRPDGLPVYPLVVVTVQRQAGKSHLAMAQTGERSFSRAKFRSWYTAQTGGDARDQFLKFDEEVVQGTALEAVVRTLRGNGHEVMKWPNGSQLRPHPPTETALHGKQSDRNDIDEGWAFSEDEGKLLLQAISPTQLTRRGAQTFIWSAGGTAASTWLAALVARGRAGDPSMAYFEWGIPDEADPEDLDVIAAHHPAFGHLVTMESLKAMRAQFGDDVAGWARAAGNRWTEVLGGAIRLGEWEAVRYADAIPDGAPVGYGAARSADGSQVVVAAAAEVDGRIVAEVLDVLPVFGAASSVRDWIAGGALAVDPSGPSASLADELERLGARMVPMRSRDAAAATSNLLDGIAARAYLFRQHVALDAAVKVAGTRAIGDGGKTLARVAAGAPIAALEACREAAWAVTHRPRELGKPVVRFGQEVA